MTKEEKLNRIEEAQELLQQTIDTLKPLADDDNYFKHYFLDRLTIMKGENEFLTQDLNLDEMKERIERKEEEEGEEE